MNTSEAEYFTLVEDARLTMLPHVAAYKANVDKKVMDEGVVSQIFDELSSHLDADIKAFRKKVIIDFSGVEYLSSAAITQLGYANDKCRKFGAELHLVNVKDQAVIDALKVTQTGYADSGDAKDRKAIYLHKVGMDKFIEDHHQMAMRAIGDRQCFVPYDGQYLPEGVIAYKIKDRTTKTGQPLSGIRILDDDTTVGMVREELLAIVDHIKSARAGESASQASAKQLIIDMSAVDFLSAEGISAIMEANLLFNRIGGKIALVGVQPEAMEKLSEMNLVKLLNATDAGMHDWVQNAKSRGAA